MMNALSLVALGFFLGMRHATDPDHVIPGVGDRNSVIQITVTHPYQLINPILWPLVGGDGRITLRVSATMKNEPF